MRVSTLWRVLRGKQTLIRTSSGCGQKSLGLQSEVTLATYDSFVSRNASAEMRHNPLKAQLCTSRGALAPRGGGRDPHKSGKDAMKFRIVTVLVNKYLPHLLQADQARS